MEMCEFEEKNALSGERISSTKNRAVKIIGKKKATKRTTEAIC